MAGLADFFADGVDGGLDEVFGGPVGFGFADVEEEIPEEFGAVFGVVDFGVELDGPDIARWICDAGDGVGGFGGQMESCGRASALSPWDIQAVMVAGSSAKRGLVSKQDDFGVAVFALVAGTDLPPR